MISDVLWLVAPPMLLLATWLILRRAHSTSAIFLRTWVGLELALFSIGLAMPPGTEGTRLAGGAGLSASIWFNGPVMAWLMSKRSGAAWSVVATVALPYPSAFLCFVLLALSGQIWGM